MAMQSFEDEYMTTLAHKQIAAFNEGHGWFFWNFRTEAYEPHWDYLVAWKRGWFPRNVSDYAAITALKVCGAGAKPLQPTIPPKPTAAVPHTKAEPAGPKVKTPSPNPNPDPNPYPGRPRQQRRRRQARPAPDARAPRRRAGNPNPDH